MAIPSFREPALGFQLTSAKTIAAQELPTSGAPTITVVHGSDIHMFCLIQIPTQSPTRRSTKSPSNAHQDRRTKTANVFFNSPATSLIPPQLCSLKNPIVPSSSSAKRSISSGVVVKPRLARAELARP